VKWRELEWLFIKWCQKVVVNYTCTCALEKSARSSVYWNFYWLNTLCDLLFKFVYWSVTVAVNSLFVLLLLVLLIKQDHTYSYTTTATFVITRVFVCKWQRFFYGWMHQDATWYEGRPWPRPHCARWEPSSPCPKGAQPPVNFPHMSVVAKWLHAPGYHSVRR